MQKSRRVSSKTMVRDARTRHADAVWEIGKAWDKIPARSYAMRKRLVSTAISLAQIGKRIDVIGKKYSV